METAVRVFAGELNRSTCPMEGGWSQRHPGVVAPSGARLSRVFLVGACTEVREPGHGAVRARVADPTGTFLLYAGKENPEVAEALRALAPPAFVAVTGTVRSYRTAAGAHLSVLPEAAGQVDRTIRDLWVLRTAEMTLGRLETMKAALEGAPAPPEVAAALRHYAITPASLGEIASMALHALETTRITPDADRLLCLDPRGAVIGLIAAHGGARGMPMDDLLRSGTEKGISPDTVRRVINELMAEGDCYSPCTGFVKLL